MRVVAPNLDVIVFISRVWQTTCTAVRGGGEGFVIDSPIYPDELDAVPSVLEQAGFPVSGLLCTHADWDHLLARIAFPSLPLGCGESSARRLEREPGAPQRRLREFDEEHYVANRRPLGVAGVQELPVPGGVGLGEEGAELELHPTVGHTADGVAYVMPWLRLLVCGDYLSPVEIPMISEGGSAEGYLETLARLEPLVDRSETVIPGHGAPLSADRARELLDQDREYVQRLESRDATAQLPPGRRTREQRRIHARNVITLGRS